METSSQLTHLKWWVIEHNITYLYIPQTNFKTVIWDIFILLALIR